MECLRLIVRKDPRLSFILQEVHVISGLSLENAQLLRQPVSKVILYLDYFFEGVCILKLHQI